VKKPKKDPIREDRIHDQAIVDAYGPEEQAMSWYYYLDDKIRFPFQAKCIAPKVVSPLRKGDTVEVRRMAPEDACSANMLVLIDWQGRKMAVPLFQLAAIDPDEFSRLLFGSQVSLTVGLVGIAISFTLGLILGGISGYYGGWVDALLMRGSEVWDIPFTEMVELRSVIDRFVTSVDWPVLTVVMSDDSLSNDDGIIERDLIADVSMLASLDAWMQLRHRRFVPDGIRGRLASMFDARGRPVCDPHRSMVVEHANMPRKR